MVFGDMLKHQSFSGISRRFVESLGTKYKNITVGEYIIERLVHKRVNLGFSYRQNYNIPFFNVADKFSNFNVVFNQQPDSIGPCALSYAKHTNNIGLILSTAPQGFPKIHKSLIEAQYTGIPLMLMNFYDLEFELKFSDNLQENNDNWFLKEYLTIKEADKLPNLLEYVMMRAASFGRKGPVYLNINNEILNKPVDFDKIILEDVKSKGKEEKEEKEEDLSLLQEYEKSYEQVEQQKLLK